MHIPRKSLPVAIVLCFIAASLVATSAQASEKRNPRLVLQITVDGFRGDLPLRYTDENTQPLEDTVIKRRRLTDAGNDLWTIAGERKT